MKLFSCSCLSFLFCFFVMPEARGQESTWRDISNARVLSVHTKHKSIEYLLNIYGASLLEKYCAESTVISNSVTT